MQRQCPYVAMVLAVLSLQVSELKQHRLQAAGVVSLTRAVHAGAGLLLLSTGGLAQQAAAAAQCDCGAFCACGRSAQLRQQQPEPVAAKAPPCVCAGSVAVNRSSHSRPLEQPQVSCQDLYASRLADQIKCRALCATDLNVIQACWQSPSPAHSGHFAPKLPPKYASHCSQQLNIPFDVEVCLLCMPCMIRAARLPTGSSITAKHLAQRTARTGS